MADALSAKTGPNVAGILEQESKRSDVVDAARQFILAYKRLENTPSSHNLDAYKENRRLLLRSVAFYELSIGEYQWAIDLEEAISCVTSIQPS